VSVKAVPTAAAAALVLTSVPFLKKTAGPISEALIEEPSDRVVGNAVICTVVTVAIASFLRLRVI
jgi:hypothetical protein